MAAPLVVCLWLALDHAVAADSTEFLHEIPTAECAEVLVSNGHEACAAALQPRWMARTSLVYFDRIGADTLHLMRGTTNSSDLLSADQFEFDWNTGYDVSLIRHAWDETSVEFRYLNVGTLDANAFVPIGGGDLRLLSTPPVDFPDIQSINAGLTSRLSTFEANWHLPVYEVAKLFAGFRYLSLDEQLNAQLNGNAQSFQFEGVTRNDLYGGQLGIATSPGKSLFGDLRVSSFAKAGVLGNRALYRGRIDTAAATLGVRSSPDDTAFVGEFGAALHWPINEFFSVTGGYNLLVVNRVAIATDQIPASDFFAGSGGNGNGTAVFHGANVTLEVRL